MNKIIILSLALCLNGCLTPHYFRGDHSQKTGRETTYEVTDHKDGFTLQMRYDKFEPGGTTAAANFAAREKMKNLAMWIAEARKRKLKPIKMDDMESRHYHNSATRYTHWRGEVRVYYTK